LPAWSRSPKAPPSSACAAATPTATAPTRSISSTSSAFRTPSSPATITPTATPPACLMYSTSSASRTSSRPAARSYSSFIIHHSRNRHRPARLGHPHALAVALAAADALAQFLAVDEVVRKALAQGFHLQALVLLQQVDVLSAEHAHRHRRARRAVVVERQLALAPEVHRRLLAGAADLLLVLRRQFRQQLARHAVEADLQGVGGVRETFTRPAEVVLRVLA